MNGKRGTEGQGVRTELREKGKKRGEGIRGCCSVLRLIRRKKGKKPDCLLLAWGERSGCCSRAFGRKEKGEGRQAGTIRDCFWRKSAANTGRDAHAAVSGKKKEKLGILLTGGEKKEGKSEWAAQAGCIELLLRLGGLLCRGRGR